MISLNIRKPKHITSKIALALAVLVLVAWSILGTGASLAWFKDETPPLKNVFNFAEFDLDLSYKNDIVTDYTPVELDTNIFGDEALYEPGYTQVVYLKVENKGTVDMRYRLSIDVRSVVTAPSVLGNEIYLPNYLRYGVLFGDSEAELTRELAQQNAVANVADLRLNNFSRWDEPIVAAGEARYIALIVFMPMEVGNQANYRGDTVPTVTMGITVDAEQVKNK